MATPAKGLAKLLLDFSSSVPEYQKDATPSSHPFQPTEYTATFRLGSQKRQKSNTVMVNVSGRKPIFGRFA
jgi:hypothetical protein